MRFSAPTTPSASAWDTFVANHVHGHILQTPAWGLLKSDFGWHSDSVALQDHTGEIVAGAQILFRRLPLRLGTLAYIPKGPLAPDSWWQDISKMNVLWQAIHQTARSHSARWLKVEGPQLDGSEPSDALRDAGFVPSPQTIQPPRTIVLDIHDDDDAIMARMKQKTRYNIRLSAKKDVVVRQGTAADLPSFNAMMDVTGERDAFGVHSAAYYEQVFRLFEPTGRVALFIASFEGQDLAGVMAFALGKTAWYFYGASTNEERKRMPAYGVQWAAIQWAKAQGCTQYDLWGVPDADEEALEAGFTERSDGLWGVYRFKRGFGGELVRQMPAWDYVYSKPVYALYQQYLRRTGRTE